MKLLVQQNRVVGTAELGYDGPESVVDAPDGFDMARMADYVVEGGIASLPPVDVALLEREAAKAARQAVVEAITVTTAAGNTFDGDETSQTRMARAILVLSTGAAASVLWVLADNTVIQASAAELTEALALAGAAQAALWVVQPAQPVSEPAPAVDPVPTEPVPATEPAPAAP